MKALGLIGDRDDVGRLIERLRVEKDAEAQTWGTAAILKNANDQGIAQICSDAGLQSSVPLILAARLYAPDHWIAAHWKPVTVSLNDDDLTLKWAIFLAGYDRAPDSLFHPRYANRVFLGELNNHATQEISEYSIWALWEREDCGVEDLKVSPDKFLNHPENARKWLYRISMQSSDRLLIDPDRLDDFRRKDRSVSAREGLALGLGELVDERFDEVTLDWYDDEQAPVIKEALLTGMAAKSDNNSDFAYLVESRFRNEAATSGFRTRLLAATVGTAIHRKLQKINYEDEGLRQGLLDVGSNFTIVNKGELILAGASFSAGRDINAKNIVGGDAIGSALSTVENIPADRAHDQALLREVLEFLRSSSVPPAQKESIVKSVDEVAKSADKTTKSSLLAKLKGLGDVIGASAALSELIEKAQEWSS